MSKDQSIQAEILSQKEAFLTEVKLSAQDVVSGRLVTSADARRHIQRRIDGL